MKDGRPSSARVHASMNRPLLLLALLASAGAVTFGREEPGEEPSAEYEEDVLFEEPFWMEYVDKLKGSVDGGALLRARRWGTRELPAPSSSPP